MIAPFRLTVRLPDGSEHCVAAIGFRADGRVSRIDTFGIGGDSLKNGWYTIEGEELDLVSLIVQLQADDQ